MLFLCLVKSLSYSGKLVSVIPLGKNHSNGVCMHHIDPQNTEHFRAPVTLHNDKAKIY